MRLLPFAAAADNARLTRKRQETPLDIEPNTLASAARSSVQLIRLRFRWYPEPPWPGVSGEIQRRPAAGPSRHTSLRSVTRTS
jgi:hypothetical protein